MNRLVPTELTCPPHMSSFKRAVAALVRAYFPESALVLHPEEFEEELKEASDATTTKGDESETKEKDSDLDKTPISKEEEETTSKESKPKEVKVQDARSKEVRNSFTVPNGALWAIQFERRAGMKTLDRDAVINEVGRMVGKEYTVNLGKPDYSVVIEVNNVRRQNYREY